MSSVSQIAVEIVKREGGYVNDPDDPGGPTNHGVTLASLRRLGLDLNRDGRVNEADLRALSPKRAVEIFLEHYYYRPGLSALPPVLQASVFDMYVNAGSNAVKILQRLLIDFDQDIAVDGRLGPQTIKAAARAFGLAPEFLADAYGIARRNYYYALADRRPASRKYARKRDGTKGGWIKRAEVFIAPKYHLSPAQHLERTAKWG